MLFVVPPEPGTVRCRAEPRHQEWYRGIAHYHLVQAEPVPDGSGVEPCSVWCRTGVLYWTVQDGGFMQKTLDLKQTLNLRCKS